MDSSEEKKDIEDQINNQETASIPVVEPQVDQLQSENQQVIQNKSDDLPIVADLFQQQISSYKETEKEPEKHHYSTNEEIQDLYHELKDNSEMKQDIKISLKLKLNQLHEQFVKTTSREQERRLEVNSIQTQLEQRLLNAQEITELKKELRLAQQKANYHQQRMQGTSLYFLIIGFMQECEEFQFKKEELIIEQEQVKKTPISYRETQLLSEIKDRELELLQTQTQMEGLRRDMEDRKSQYQKLKTAYDKLITSKEEVLQNLEIEKKVPAVYEKQAEEVEKQLSELQKQINHQVDLLIELQNQHQKLTNKKSELEEISLNIRADNEKRKIQIHQTEKECDLLIKEKEIQKEKFALEREEKIRLESQFKKVLQDIRLNHDLLVKVNREKDATLKNLRRMENLVSNAKLQAPLLNKKCDDAMVALNHTKRESFELKKILNDLRQDIDLGIYNYLQFEQIEEDEKEKVEKNMLVNNELEKLQQNLIIDCQKLQKQADRLSIERQMKAREYVRLVKKSQELEMEIKYKNFTLSEEKKRYNELLQQSRDMHQLYEEIKSEKNRYFNMIQSAQQRKLELQEKIGILKSEIEILKSTFTKKSLDLQNELKSLQELSSSRDIYRSEANKFLNVYRKQRDRCEQAQIQLELIQKVVKNKEIILSDLTSDYQRVVKQRDLNAKILLERNDELCLLNEKFNYHNKIMKEAEQQFIQKDEEFRQLETLKKNLMRQRKIIHQTATEYRENLEKFELMNKEFDQLYERETELNRKLEGPESIETFGKELPGQDLEKEKLEKKILFISKRITEKEYYLSEKEKVLTKVNEEIQEIQQQLYKDRKKAEKDLKKFNHYKKSIEKENDKLKSLMSEVAMNHAKNELTEKEIQQKKEQLELLLSGQMEKELKQELKKESKSLEKQKEIEHTKQLLDRLGIDSEHYNRPIIQQNKESMVFFTLKDGTKSAALPRATAYWTKHIRHQTGFEHDLDLPVPYGQFPPMQPLNTETNIKRFTKKPKEHPIEI